MRDPLLEVKCLSLRLATASASSSCSPSTMGIRDRIASVLAFKALPVTFVTIVVYAAIYISVAILDELPAVPAPSKQLGLDIDVAYDDLHKVNKLFKQEEQLLSSSERLRAFRIHTTHTRTTLYGTISSPASKRLPPNPPSSPSTMTF